MQTGKIQSTLKWGGVTLLAVLLAGCIWANNPYEKCYIADSPSDNIGKRKKGNSEGKIELRFSYSRGVNFAIYAEEEIALLEEGYERLGRSSFYGTHAPWRGAVDVAERIGADLILFREHFREREGRVGVMVTPSVSTSYTSGNVYAHTYGASATGTYSGTTTTTSYNTSTYQYSVDTYNQEAVFFRKRPDGSGFYGAYIDCPQLLPGDDPATPVTLRILAVVKGSRAWRDGVRRGDVVKTVNGQKITTLQDAQSFRMTESVVSDVVTERMSADGKTTKTEEK